LYPASAKNQNNKRPRSSHGYQISSKNLTLQKFDELDKLMINNITTLKDEVQKMNFEHYLSGLLSVRHKQETVDMPIKVLDSIIQFEEEG